ncbi:MAG TPA: glycosyltransferase family 4 protein [Chloroflexota bacterium]|nr:glycosyltransferase family 4 protein [Chloroflexota bacterium]
MPEPFMAQLVTLGDPAQLTGGYLYHQRVAALAPAHGVRLAFCSFPEAAFPLPALAARRLARALLAAQPQAVVIDSLAAAYLAPVVRELSAALPLVGSVHQPPGGLDHGPLRTRLQARLDLLVYRRAALLLVASASLAETLTACGIRPSRIQVVPPGRDIPAAPASPAGDLRQGRAAAFLCVGNWVARKGLLLLLEAFARLPADTATLHLVGRTDVDHSYTARVRARLARPDLRGRVVVHGPVAPAQVAALYRAADVFVLPSTQEPYGTVYSEAMALGLPVVGVAAGNLPHLATDGVEGRIVAPGDVTGLAAALLELARDEPLRRRLGAAARARALTHPTWEETAARFCAALRAVAVCR